MKRYLFLLLPFYSFAMQLTPLDCDECIQVKNADTLRFACSVLVLQQNAISHKQALEYARKHYASPLKCNQCAVDDIRKKME